MAAPTAEHPQQRPQGLPGINSLTNGIPPPQQQQRLSTDQHVSPESTRDSGTWPQPHTSKHNSATSGLNVSTLLNPDDSPQRNSIPSTPLSARLPPSAQVGASQLPSINQGFQDNRDFRNSYASDNRDSYHPSLDSRRSSVDSRMHQGLGNLYINNPTSPYESQNPSQVSLAQSLRRPNGGPPLSPLSGRPSSIRSHAPRVAPPIMPVGRFPGGPDPTAAKPTQGHAWAFPDAPIPEERRESDESDESSLRGGMSRTGSIAASSIRSSIFSNDSHMPPGQRRFDEDATTHHHTLQHRTISSIQNESMPGSIGNYSRTPELRVSHKLAERKRRSEMKDLFEDLNKAVPSGAGAKASKWEILTKAIDHIRQVQHEGSQLREAVHRLQDESEYAHSARKENDMLKTELQVMHQHLRRMDPNAPHVYGHFTNSLQHPQEQHAPQTNGTSGGVNLPPINTNGTSGGAAAGPQYGAPPPQPAPMQGVEYGSGYARR